MTTRSWSYGRRTSLHSLWDDVVGARAAARDIVAAPGAGGQPLAWAEESLDLVRGWVYAAGAGEELPDWYLDRASAEARARLELAAGRLAAVLEASLSGAPLGFADPVADGYSRDEPGWLTVLMYRAANLGTRGAALLGGGLLALLGGGWLLWRRRRRPQSELLAAI